MAALPVLIVHGIWDTAARIEPMARGLRERGVDVADCFTLVPNNGRAQIAALASQVQTQVDRVRTERGVPQIDLIGFSMGALTARYYVQRCGGKAHVRRFISISGPHAGTLAAYALPFAGVRQMRPGSALLCDLAADVDPWGSVEVHCLYTPYDLMIVPAQSAVLRGARSVHELPVRLHRWMMRDRRVLDIVSETLR